MYLLSNGVQVPKIAYGTYQSCEKGVISKAIECGYRYFDSASLYESERGLGEAIKSSEISRGEFQIATKVWIDEMGYKGTQEALKRSLGRLQMDYVDFYLIHWPRQNEDDTDWKRRDVDTWRAMEEAVAAGKIKNLGLSNFLPHHLDNILEHCEIKPVIDQLELHPGYSQEYAVRYCIENGVLPQAWSPLGRSSLTGNDLIAKFAAKYNKSVAQVCIRFLLQKGVMPIVKTSTESRMRENMDVFDFEISDEDMKILSCMPQNTWLGEHPDFSIPKKASNIEQ